MKDVIGEVLDVEPFLNEEDNKKPPIVHNPVQTTQKVVDTDADYARKNLYDLIEKGSMAIDELLTIAQQSQHPRSYEVLSTLMKTMVETNKDLLALQETKKKLLEQDKDTKDQNKTVTNNTLFVGSTTELLKALKKDD